MNFAQIGETIESLYLGAQSKTFEWIGDPKDFVYVCHYQWRREGFLDSLPWPLEEVPEFHELYTKAFRRTDIGIQLKAFQNLQLFWFGVHRRVQWVEMRLILTLYVWGLATMRQGENPNWTWVGWR
jgi:hypothetical protein